MKLCDHYDWDDFEVVCKKCNTQISLVETVARRCIDIVTRLMGDGTAWPDCGDPKKESAIDGKKLAQAIRKEFNLDEKV